MCLAIPMKITKIEGNDAVCDVDGISTKASLGFLENVKVGDYVIVHAGFVLQKVDELHAKETIEIFREIAQYRD